MCSGLSKSNSRVPRLACPTVSSALLDKPAMAPDLQSREGLTTSATATVGPIKVLHMHGRMGRGGAEMRTVEIFRNIDRRRYQFHFCALSGMYGELDDEIRVLGGEVHLMRQGIGGFKRRFGDLLRREKYDVVHSHLYFQSGYFLRLAAQNGVPVRVAQFRCSQLQRCGTAARRTARWLLSPFVQRYASQRVLRGWIDRHATHILGSSEGVLSATWGPQWTSDPRCRVVYPGLEVPPFAAVSDGAAVRQDLGLPEDAPFFIHVGRMTEAKNHLRLLSIFCELLQRSPMARLVLVSRVAVTPDEMAVERVVRRRIAKLALANRIVLSGERTDVPRLLKAADVLIFPSRWEGFGGVVLEACAAGTPSVCSDLPSIREIGDCLPGIRRLSLDEPDAAWADAACALAARPPDKQSRRVALQSFTESQFTVERCTKSLCGIWDTSAEPDAVGGNAHG